MNDLNLFVIYGVGIISLLVLYFYITRHEKHHPKH